MSIQTSTTVITPAIGGSAAGSPAASRPLDVPRLAGFARRLRRRIAAAWRDAAAMDAEVNRRRDEAILFYYTHSGR